MKQSISSQVCDAIVDDIFNHTYQPGQILTERALIEAYGCSKTTVREALVALCQRQIVRSIPRCGYEILRVERSTITDILEYRYILETGCLRRCFDTITPRHILRLTELDETCCDPEKAGDLWSHWEHNAAFHLELIRLAGNRYATQQLTQALETLKRAYVQYYWDKRQQVLTAEDMRHHRLLLEALRAQDLESACHILAQDIQSFAY